MGAIAREVLSETSGEIAREILREIASETSREIARDQRRCYEERERERESCIPAIGHFHCN